MTRPLLPAPFVVGAARSGTTLLRLMLDSHSDLAIPPETHFLPELIRASRQPGASPEELADLVVAQRRWADFGLDGAQLRTRFAAIEPFDVATAIRAFYEAYASGAGKPRWGDKTPPYGLRMRLIGRTLPEARFIHLIRDARDVFLSQASRRPTRPPASRVARRWERRVRAARTGAGEVDHYLELRYEDLVVEPERELRRICAFCELPWDASMLAYHQRAAERLEEMDRPIPGGRAGEERLAMHALTTEPPRSDRIARWRTELSAREISDIEAAAGNLLDDLGYARAGDG